MIIIIVNLTWSSLFSQLSWLTLINTLCPFSTYCLGPPNTPSFPGFLILDLDAVNVSPFCRQHSIWLCQWRVLEECWRKNGILCLESVLSFLLVWCTARGHLPYQQSVFFLFFFFSRKHWQWWRASSGCPLVSFSGTPAGNFPETGFLFTSSGMRYLSKHHHPIGLSNTFSIKVWITPGVER